MYIGVNRARLHHALHKSMAAALQHHVLQETFALPHGGGDVVPHSQRCIAHSTIDNSDCVVIPRCPRKARKKCLHHLITVLHAPVLEEVLHDKRAVGVCAEIEGMGHDVVNEAREQCLREVFQHSLADSATKNDVWRQIPCCTHTGFLTQ